MLIISSYFSELAYDTLFLVKKCSDTYDSEWSKILITPNKHSAIRGKNHHHKELRSSSTPNGVAGNSL